MEYTTAKEPEEITPKVPWSKWEWLGCVRPVYDLAGVESWGERYRCPKCGFVHTCIQDHGHYVFCPSCGEQNMGVTA